MNGFFFCKDTKETKAYWPCKLNTKNHCHVRSFIKRMCPRVKKISLAFSLNSPFIRDIRSSLIFCMYSLSNSRDMLKRAKFIGKELQFAFFWNFDFSYSAWPHSVAPQSVTLSQSETLFSKKECYSLGSYTVKHGTFWPKL